MNAKRFSSARLEKAREDRRVEEIAVATGVSSGTVRNWLSGSQRPDADELAAIAELTGRPLDFFFEQVA